MIYVEASRLRLRDWDETDIVPFSALNADENVMQYFPKTLSTEETKAFYTLIVDKIKANGYGLFAVEEKETNEFLGFIGFHRATFEADFTPCIGKYSEKTCVILYKFGFAEMIRLLSWGTKKECECIKRSGHRKEREHAEKIESEQLVQRLSPQTNR
ncbi:GNAT family N-acetyltransferase [Virgibacillus dokdonensis]|uniref:GNAT family N-acetyltransferase n=1 Tax=Virgibacillus dokdonensis TaxID=302167 RepID=UPI00098AC6AC|nr:GNAT family N-acetyltransferase [Virgibacillus dokdonensis]